MKTLIIFITGIFMSMGISAQTITYGYDEAGNRINRKIVYLKSSKSLKSAQTDTTANPQTDTAAKEKEAPGPVTDKAGDMQIDVYPNPTKDELQVKITGAKTNTCRVTVVDMDGKTIYQNKDFGLSGAIDLSHQAKGMYIMRIEVGEEVSEWKVVRE
jgi:hypothetical protein